VHRDVLAMGDHDIPCDELDEVSDRRAQWPEIAARRRSVVAVPAQALERDEHAAVIRVEALGARERRRPRELAQHLAVTRPADVDLVEKGRDRLVVSAEQLEALERAVVGLLELLPCRGRLLHAAIVSPSPPGFAVAG